MNVNPKKFVYQFTSYYVIAIPFARSLYRNDITNLSEGVFDKLINLWKLLVFLPSSAAMRNERIDNNINCNGNNCFESLLALR